MIIRFNPLNELKKEVKSRVYNIQDWDGSIEPHAITFSAFHTGQSCDPIWLIPLGGTIAVRLKYTETKQQMAFSDG